MAKRGKLMVIEGTDGSGKATQTRLLAEKLQKEGYSVKTINFPQYGKESARLIEQYLAGEFGPADTVDPHEVSKYFAWDRKEAAPTMNVWLDQGNIVVANRYQQSNKGHQAVSIKDPAEREKFMEWLDDLEFNQYKIPRPDKVVFLHVPAEIAQKLAKERGGRKDIHEESLEHLKEAERIYTELAKKEGWIVVECTKYKKLMSIEEIHGILWEKIKPFLE